MSLNREILLYLLFLTLFLLAPQRTAAQKAVGQDKQRDAEEIGDRIVQRFHETLDFNTIFKEFFVSDPKMRLLEVEMVFGHKLNPKFRNKIDNTAVERAYVAQMTFLHLMSDYVFTQGRELQPPPGMGEAYEAVTRTDISEFTSGKELDQRFNEKYDRLNGILRKPLSPEAFRSESYRRSVENFREPEETADAAQMLKDFGMSKDIKVYVVKREFFNYFLIEEKGALKVFTVSLRTKERL